MCLIDKFRSIDFKIRTPLYVYGSGSLSLLGIKNRECKELDIYTDDMPEFEKEKLASYLGIILDVGKKSFVKEFESLYDWQDVLSSHNISIKSLSLQSMIIMKFVAYARLKRGQYRKYDLPKKHLADFYALPIDWAFLESKIDKISELAEFHGKEYYEEVFSDLYRWRGYAQ